MAEQHRDPGIQVGCFLRPSRTFVSVRIIFLLLALDRRQGRLFNLFVASIHSFTSIQNYLLISLSAGGMPPQRFWLWKYQKCPVNQGLPSIRTNACFYLVIFLYIFSTRQAGWAGHSRLTRAQESSLTRLYPFPLLFPGLGFITKPGLRRGRRLRHTALRCNNNRILNGIVMVRWEGVWGTPKICLAFPK